MASSTSSALFILSAIFQVGGTLTADWSASHIYNDAWPAHAKFHTGQTISMAIVLATAGLYFAFRPKTAATGSVANDVFTAMLFLDVYWVTQALAFLYPGTHWCDPPFCQDVPFPPQLAVQAFGLSINTAAWWFGRTAVRGGEIVGDRRKAL